MPHLYSQLLLEKVNRKLWKASRSDWFSFEHRVPRKDHTWFKGLAVNYNLRINPLVQKLKDEKQVSMTSIVTVRGWMKSGGTAARVSPKLPLYSVERKLGLWTKQRQLSWKVEGKSIEQATTGMTKNKLVT